LNSLEIVKLNKAINDRIGFLKSTKFDSVNTTRSVLTSSLNFTGFVQRE